MSFNTAAAAGVSAASSGVNWAQVAGFATQVVGTYTSAQGAATQARAQNETIAANIAMANAQGASVQRKAAADQQALMRRVSQMKGTQRAAMAARGLDLSEGTPANILASTDLMAQTDLETIKQNALQDAWGYRVQAQGYAAQRKNPQQAAVTSLLTNAPAVASSWLKLRDSLPKSWSF